MQRASFELLGGVVKRSVDQTQKGTPYGVGVHVQDRHSGGGCDRKRGGELTRDLALTPRDHIDIFYRGWLSSPPFSGIYIYTHACVPGVEPFLLSSLRAYTRRYQSLLHLLPLYRFLQRSRALGHY